MTRNKKSSLAMFARPLTALALTTAVLIVSVSGCGGCQRVPDWWTQEGSIDSQPLAERPQREDGPLFEKIDAAHTGIDFTITWDKPAKYDRLFYGQNTGGGVCIGDYDGDGRPDVYLTSPSGGNRLYRNLGDFRFEDVTEAAGLLDADFWGNGATFVDIDNDYDLDLYLCGYDMPNRLYINQGDGTFVERAAEYGLDYQGASVMMNFADYDNDGDLDGYLLTAGLQPGKEHAFAVLYEGDKPVIPDDLREYWKLIYVPGDRAKQVEAAQFDHFYRNNGDGTFTEVTKAAGIDGADFGQAAIWFDFNNDGWVDLYVANDYWGPDYLYRNNGDGTFTDVAPTMIAHTPRSSMGVDAADINGDGRIDLLATDMSGTNHYKQKLGMGDMSTSGWFLEYGQPRQYMRNAVFLNTGSERFMEVAHLTGLANTDWTWTPRFEDFDSDGRVDLFVTNGMTRDFMNTDLNDLCVSRHKEGTPEFFAFWREQGFKKDHNLAFKNLGDLRFKSVGKEWGLDLLGVSFGAATGDLDGDGDLDLVVNNMDQPAGVYRNRSSRGNLVKIRLRGTLSNRYGIGATVRLRTAAGEQVRNHVVTRGWTSCGESIIHFGLGDEAKIQQLAVHWPSGHVQRFENLDAGRSYTITEPFSDAPPLAKPTPPETLFVASDRLQAARHEEQPFDDFKRQPLLPNKLSQLGPGIAWGDVDGDGDEDMYLCGAKGQAGILLINTGRGRFEPAEQTFEAAAASEEMAALFFDFNGDGDQDLYITSGGVECEKADASLANRLYLNNGRGMFSLAPQGTLPDLRDSSGIVVAADYDRDGDLDLFVGGRSVPGEYPTTPSSRLLRDDGGRFIDVTDTVAPGLKQTGMVTAALWSDVDGDGWIDLLLTHEWGPVKLYRNDGGKLVDWTKQAGLAERLGWWNGIAGGDVDGDGDIDYVVTNFGLNTKYHPSSEKPARIYYADFDGTGKKRIIEAKVAKEGMLPVRGKSCSQNAMPMLRDKFPTFHSFASATLIDIYTPECLGDALRLEANTLESGVLINDGQGRFTFRPLPRLAQVAPCFGVVLLDVDADGNLDLALAQNFFGPQRETGRMDGGLGLLLLGRGDGSFEPIWPDRSGIVVPGDAKGLAVADVNADGRPDLVFTVNDGPLVVLENNSPKSNRSFAVRLKGRKGNLSGVGARVTLHMQDGSKQTAEVYAGGSYLSQSSHVLYFGLGKSGQVDRVAVRWPNQQKTSYPVKPDARRITIREVPRD